MEEICIILIIDWIVESVCLYQNGCALYDRWLDECFRDVSQKGQSFQKRRNYILDERLQTVFLSLLEEHALMNLSQ